MTNKDTVVYTAVWLLLVLSTLGAWVIGHQAPITVHAPPMAIAGGILGLAFLKVAMVMAVFMDLRIAPMRLIALAAAWIVIECGVLVILITR